MQSGSNNDSLPTYHKSKIIDPFAGGRCLNAVYHRDDLTGIQTAIMIYFGGRLDFRDFLHSKITVSVSQICKAIKFKETAVKRAIKELIEMGYIYVENNFDERGFKIENTYSISDYFFKCYVDSLLSHVVDSRETTYDSRETTSNIPVFNDPLSEAQRSEEKENKINQISKNSRDREAEGEPRSLHQNDIKQRLLEQRTDSPMANSAHDDVNEIDFFDTEKKTKLPKVTKWHRRMVMIFKPDIELKSFVRDNDILFLTDEIFEKYGDLAKEMIDDVYAWAKDNGKLGKIKWKANRVWEAMDIAKNKIEGKNSLKD